MVVNGKVDTIRTETLTNNCDWAAGFVTGITDGSLRRAAKRKRRAPAKAGLSERSG